MHIRHVFISILWSFALLIAPVETSAQDPPENDTVENDAVKEHWEIKTSPAGARIYVNWDFVGITPLEVPKHQLKTDDLFVATLEGHRPISRVIIKPHSLYLRMSLERPYPRRKILLRVLGTPDDELVDTLIKRLAGADFFVHPMADTDVLEQHLLAIGNRDKAPFLAWARSYFESAYWLVLELPKADPRLDLSSLLLPSEVAAEPVADAKEPTKTPRAQLRLIDLDGGALASSTTFDGSHFLDKSRRQTKARQKILDEVVAHLEQWIAEKAVEEEVLTIITPGGDTVPDSRGSR